MPVRATVSNPHRESAVAGGAAGDAFRAAYERGDVRTVRVCFPDYYGGLRGRRVPASAVIDQDSLQGFCSAALVWDYRCELSEQTPFANYATGYADFYERMDPSTAIVCGWAPGEGLMLGDCLTLAGDPVPVDTRHVLRRVIRALEGEEPVLRLALQFRVPGRERGLSPGAPDPFVDAVLDGLIGSGIGVVALQPLADGGFRLVLAAAPALRACDAAVVAKAAVKEIAVRTGTRATFMARPPQTAFGCALELELAGGAVDVEATRRRLSDLAMFLRPTANAYKRGVAAAGPRGDLAVARGHVICTAASSDANAYLAVATVLAAANASARGGDTTMPRALHEAVERAEAAEWPRDWFDAEFLANATALARWEADVAAESVSESDWDRYGEYA